MNSNQTLDKGNRIVFIDYIKMIAPFMVMLVHASENFYGADSSGLAGPQSFIACEDNRFWVAFYDGFLCRTCVPLFMVVSAFLLVPMKPGVSMVSFYRRRFMRILPPMLCFMLIYSLLPLLWGGMTWEQSVADLKMLAFNFPSMAGHLWFMYPLISLYLIIPVVSPWLEKSTAREERIFLYIFTFSTLLPWLHRGVGEELFGECFWNGFNAFWYCSGFLGYLVLAHYIRKHLSWSSAKKMRIGLLCFLVGGAFTGWSFWYKGTPGVLIYTPTLEWSWEFCTLNVLVATFGAFLMFSCIKIKQVPRIVEQLSRMSFGMYLVHMIFLSTIAPAIIGSDVAQPLLPVWLAIPVIAILTYVCCAVTVWLVRLLPGSKYIVG